MRVASDVAQAYNGLNLFLKENSKNVALFGNVFSFSKCERFCEYFFPSSKKHNYKQKMRVASDVAQAIFHTIG